jgi:hypothetical protein
MTAVPPSSVIGNPLSAFLLGFDGIGGIEGWRWLFILEGVQPFCSASQSGSICRIGQPRRAFSVRRRGVG